LHPCCCPDGAALTQCCKGTKKLRCRILRLDFQRI